VKESGGAGSRIPPGDVGFDLSRSVSRAVPVADELVEGDRTDVSIGVDPSAGRIVEKRDLVAVRVAAAIARWMTSRDAPTLRCALLQILLMLDQ